MAHIVVTAGPIPARLDSVKYVTNRFKGALARMTAVMLTKKGHRITLVKSKHSDIVPDPKWDCIDVTDVQDYIDKTLDINADVYVLAAAVANLQPTKPWAGKFPSHNYKAGEKFNIEFEISPRLIDMVKREHSRSSLVGYKLFDGTDEELVDAARHTMYDSKANIVFGNHPKWANERKIAVTPDGAIHGMPFDEHVCMIDRLARARWYRTKYSANDGTSPPWTDDDLMNIIEKYPRCKVGRYTFGSFAYRLPTPGTSFATTVRRKREHITHEHTIVTSVDHERRTVYVSGAKATLNAPLLDTILGDCPDVKVIIHGHRQLPQMKTVPYEFPGTREEVTSVGTAFCAENAVKLPVNIKNHGYIAGFKSTKECLRWLNEHETGKD